MSKQSLESVLKERGPELTAYALGELSQPEMDALYKEFSNNPDVMAYLEDMKALGGLISETAPVKAGLVLTEAQKEMVMASQPLRKSFFSRFAIPKLYVPALGAAAVVLLIVVAVTKNHESIIDGSIEVINDAYVFEDDMVDKESYGEISDIDLRNKSASDAEESVPSGLSEGRSGGYAGVGSPKKAMAPASGAYDGGRDKHLYFGKGESYKRKEYQPSRPYSHTSGDDYLQIVENIFVPVRKEPLSTFSIDVDTASYSQVRARLIDSELPQAGLVRAEEFINYFAYNYEKPSGDKPFSVHVEVTNAPWNTKHHLVRIGLLGAKTPESERKANNFVFLVDVSGSMDMDGKLPLVKSSLKMLTSKLRREDRVAIVTYSGSTEVVLESTSGANKEKIVEAIDRLNADGSTNGESGIQLAYKIAVNNKISDGNNRVVLATDGDFNVGVTDESTLEEMIEKKAKSTGVFLTVLGYGMGNYKDHRMQVLANKGNGNNYYIDSEREARKVLVEQGAGTLNAIAKDVKIQVEFHPKHVQSYRLIGYEKRILNAEDFNDDSKDAGEIGEGHTVTALYEIIPAGAPGSVDPLKYQKSVEQDVGDSGELLTVKLRYKKPKSDVSELIEVPVKNKVTPLKAASSDTQFAAAVAGYTMVLTNSKHKGDFTLRKAQSLAAQNLNHNGKRDVYRAEFVELIKKTRSLMDSEDSDAP